MNKRVNRREFLKTGAVLSGGSMIAGSQFLDAGTLPDLAVVKGADSYRSTIKAVEKIGGMGRFVPRNTKVALLANAQRNNPGAFTHPEIVKAVIHLCKEAGAVQINFLSWLPRSNWESTGLLQAIQAGGGQLVIVNNDETMFRPTPITKGVTLKECRIMNCFFEYDVFITMPITKDHAGNKFTGTLKNMMGLNSPLNNRTFHKPNWTTDPEAIEYLDQCIADLNLALRPALCVVDATEFIITNGPFGPGKLLSPQKVVVGTDRVAIDAYCASLWGLDPAAIHSIARAHAHGIGEIDLKKMVVKEYRN